MNGDRNVADANERTDPSSTRCARCGGRIEVKARGRRPKWCSKSSRHRAWEQNRAAASGQSAVQVVERVIEREKIVPVAQQPRGRE
jgi:DNA-directed RNA polymerase subunit RPC12/RpoP